MYSVKDREFVASEFSSGVAVTKISLRGQVMLNTLWFGLNAQSSALLPIVIPTQIVLFISSNQVGSTQQVLFLSWLMIAASIISLFMPPLIGALSDQTPSNIGRRRPYIMAGGLVLVISTPLLVNANNMAVFVAGLGLLLLGKNILTPAYQGLLPDCVPEEQRGVTAGFVGGMTILGNVVGLGLAALLLGGVNQHAFSMSMIRYNAGIYYIITAFFVLIGVLITVFGVREIPSLGLKSGTSSRNGKTFLELTKHYLKAWSEPWSNHNFRMVFLARVSLILGLTLFMTFIEYYFARVQHIANFVLATGIIAILALGGAVISGLVSGILSDRFKRRAPVVCVATLCMSLAALAFVILPATLMSWLWVLGILFGLGYGAYTSVNWALSIDVLPSLEKAGKDLGIWNASSTLPTIVAPLLGSMIINIAAGAGQTASGYRAVFGAAALFFFLAAAGMLFVKK